MLYGLAQARRRPDPDHPLGHGRELYFWSFIVAILIFALGAGVSIYEGLSHLRHPVPIEHPGLNYVVLALAAVLELGSWWVAFRTVRKSKGSLGYWQALRQSKDPSQFTVLVEDSAALLGLAIAALGVYGATALQRPRLDGLASIAIGLLLAAVAALLARESKSLLIGEPADPQIVASILRIARAMPEVRQANSVLTVHLAPDQIVAALSLDLRDDLRTPQIEAAIAELERRIVAAHPQVTALFVKPQSGAQFTPTASAERR